MDDFNNILVLQYGTEFDDERTVFLEVESIRDKDDRIVHFFNLHTDGDNAYGPNITSIYAFQVECDSLEWGGMNALDCGINNLFCYPERS